MLDTVGVDPSTEQFRLGMVIPARYTQEPKADRLKMWLQLCVELIAQLDFELKSLLSIGLQDLYSHRKWNL